MSIVPDVSFRFEKESHKWDIALFVRDRDGFLGALKDSSETVRDLIRTRGNAEHAIGDILNNPGNFIQRLYFLKDGNPSNGPNDEPGYIAFNERGDVVQARGVSKKNKPYDVPCAGVTAKDLKAIQRRP